MIASAVTSLTALALAALNSLPIAYTDRAPELEQAKVAQYQALANGIGEVCLQPFGGRSPRECVAVMVMTSHHEAANSLDIHAGKCRRYQCDPHMVKGVIEFTSRSVFQLKRNGLDDDSWARLVGVENTRFQVRIAFRRMASGHNFCRRSAPWPSSVIRGYAGSARCEKPILREAERLRTYARLVNR